MVDTYYKNAKVYKDDKAFLKALEKSAEDNDSEAEKILNKIFKPGVGKKPKTEDDILELMVAAAKKDNKYSYWYYNSYVKVQCLPTGSVYAVENEKGKKLSYRTFIDIIRDKYNIEINPFTFIKNAKKKFVIDEEKNKGTQKERDEYLANKSALIAAYDIIITYFFQTERYKHAISMIEEVLKRFNNTAIGLSRGRYYYTGNETKERTMSIVREAMCLLVGGLNDSEFMKSGAANTIMDSYREGLEKYQLDILTDETIINYHALITRKYTNLFEKALDKDTDNICFSSAYFGLDSLESDPALIEFLLKRARDRSNYYKGWGKPGLDDVYLGELRKEEDLEERMKRILRNYFYSKYGRGQKYAGLSKRLMAAKELMKLLKLECDLLELIMDLPEKIQVAALKGELEE